MLWTYFMYISNHMWYDEYSKTDAWYVTGGYEENNNIDVDVFDSTLDFIAAKGFNSVIIDLGDGIKYDSHPEISAPDAWSKEFFAKKLGEIRARGLMPIPKLNFSAAHHTWMKQYKRMVSTPAYYKVCSDLIAEVCELFGSPEYFHIGWDEETYSECRKLNPVVIRTGDLFWHDLLFLVKEVEKYGARPWVWSDSYWWGKAKGGDAEAYLKNMPKEVLQSNWYYRVFKSVPDGDSEMYTRTQNTYADFEKHGFDQVPTCSNISYAYNPLQTLTHCKKVISEEHLKGYMMAPWYSIDDVSRYDLLAGAQRFYYARKDVYPESFKD